MEIKMQKRTKAETRGIGFIKYEDNAEYEGEISNAVPNGKGLFRETNGYCYHGTFSCGVPIGYGVRVNTEGEVAHGIFDVFGKFITIKDEDWVDIAMWDD
jgi:hypothetical protein